MVGMEVGDAVNGIGVSAGTSVSVGGTVWVKALDVAKMACPVNATIVGREWVGKGVGVDSTNCVHADKSPRIDTRKIILSFMSGGNQSPAG